MDIVQYIPQILPIILFLVMFLMGMTLSLDDFRRVAIYPKAITIGLFSQIILLPIIGYIIIKLTSLDPVFAVGLMVICASPGGAVSNLFSHMSKGDTALSISLTACSSVITVFTIPFIINWSLANILSESDAAIQLPLVKTIFNIIKLTILPVALGMLVFHLFPDFTKKINSLIAWVSTLIIILALYLIYIKLDDIGDVGSFVRACIFPVFLLNIITLGIGFLMGKISGLNLRQCITVSIETGMQNNVLAMTIAASAAMLNNSLMAVPAGVYGLLMCSTAIIFIFVFRKMNERVK